ncbi:MAG: helix-turn-helix transcriptional regulator [Firmicutes bacterium]|nr:helix-turn-helix transcriptional regulator [Bacillota bacterium]
MDIGTQKTIADNLKLLRNTFGYTQAEVADALHLCRSTYTLYELGRKLPSTDMLVDIAELYDIRLDALLDTRTDFYIQKVFSQERSRRDIIHLVDTYFRLPPHAQGKLMERADILLEKEGFLAIG